MTSSLAERVALFKTLFGNIVLDDGDTWETLTDSSFAMVVEVSKAEHRRLCDGERVTALLAGRTGTRVAWLANEADAHDSMARLP